MKKTKKQWIISAVSYFLLIPVLVSLSVTSANGSFKSQNNANIKLRVDWETDYTSGNNFISVTAKVYLEHFSIFVSTRNNGSVSINGNTQVFSTPAIRQTSEVQSATLIATHTVQIPYKSGETVNADIIAKWYFGGVYGGKRVDWIEASAKMALNESTSSGVVSHNDAVSSGTAPVNNTAANNISTTGNVVSSNTDTDENGMGGATLLKTGVITSNTGANINLRAVWEAYESTEGMITYNVMLYLEHYSIQMRPRSGNRLTVGNTVVTFEFSGANTAEEKKQSKFLAFATYEASVDEAVNISAEFNCNGLFRGQQIGVITLSSNVSVK